MISADLLLVAVVAGPVNVPVPGPNDSLHQLRGPVSGHLPASVANSGDGARGDGERCHHGGRVVYFNKINSSVVYSQCAVSSGMARDTGS